MIRGFACGVFDFYHPGHVLMLQECAENCTHLTVAINTAENFDSRINPGKRKPVFTADERKMIISSIRYVDEVKFYTSEEELTEMMRKGGFDVRFLGDDYRGKPITAGDAIPKIHYLDRSHGYSTTDMLKRVTDRLKES